jgi:predicted dehydrogenase
MTLRVGVVGAGIMGAMHAAALSQYHASELVAVGDVVADRAGALAARYGGVAYDDYRRMLERDDLDAVAVATPDHLHRGPAVDALETGRHVLLEKPLATTLEDGEAIAAAVARAGRVLMINHGLRHKPAARMIKRALEAGELGRVKQVLGTHHWRLEGPTRTIPWAASTSIATFLLSHTVDVVRWWLADEVLDAYAAETRGLLAARGVDTHDTLAALVRFRSGTTLVVDASWIYPDGYVASGESVFNVLGERGALRFDHFAQGLERVGERTDGLVPDLEGVDWAGRLQGWWVDSVRYFVDSVLAGRAPEPDVQDGLAVLRTLVALLDSAASGEPVRA